MSRAPTTRGSVESVSVPGGNGEWPMTVPWNDPGVAFAGGVVTGLLSFVAPADEPGQRRSDRPCSDATHVAAARDRDSSRGKRARDAQTSDAQTHLMAPEGSFW